MNMMMRYILALITIAMTTSILHAEELRPNDPRLSYSDFVRMELTNDHARFDRVLDPSNQFNHDNPSARIRCRTDATDIEMNFQYTAEHIHPAVQGVGVVLIDGRVAMTFNSPEPTARPGPVVVRMMTRDETAMRDVEVLLPYGDSVEFRGLKVNPEARFETPAPRPAFRYVAYGDSITEGYQASDPTRTYAFLLAEANQWQLINMGFGGRCATTSDGKALGAIPADLVTILMGYNDYNGRRPVADYKADVDGVVRGIRRAQPTTPIFLITPLWSTEPAGPRLEDYRRAVRELAGAFKNDPNLYLIEGPDLTPHDARLFTDGIHPNDDGFAALAVNLGKAIGKLRNPSASSKPSN